MLRNIFLGKSCTWIVKKEIQKRIEIFVLHFIFTAFVSIKKIF